MCGPSLQKKTVALAASLLVLLLLLVVSTRSVPVGAVGLLDSPLRKPGVRGPGVHLVFAGIESFAILDPYTREGDWVYTTPEGSHADLTIALRLRLTPEGAALLLADGNGTNLMARLDQAIDHVIAVRLLAVSGTSLPTLDEASIAGIAVELGRYGTLEGQLGLSYREDSPVAASLRLARAWERIREIEHDTGVRILLIGLDGVDWQIAEPLIERGAMPNLAALRRRGAWGNLKALLPMLSPLLWTSIATGVTPDKHGIVDFLTTDPVTGVQQPVTGRSRRVRALWDLYTEAGRTVDVVAWWASWPAERVAGHLISDRVSYSLFDVARPAGGHRLTWPATYYDEIREWLITDDQIGHTAVASFVEISEAEFAAGRDRIARDRAAAYREPVNHLTRILASTKNYHRIALHLLNREQADLTAVYYQFVDEVSHRFIHYAEPRLRGVKDDDVRRFGRTVERAYVFQDQMLGELLEAAGPQTTVIVLSDHGFLNGPDRPPGETADVEDKPGRWHRRYGIFVAAGPGIASHRLGSISPLDIAPTVLYLAGLPVADEMDGRVLEEMIRPDFRERFPVTRIATYEIVPRRVESGPGEPAGSPSETAMMENLRSLGYIGGGSATGEQPIATAAAGSVTSHVNLAASLLAAGELDRAEAEIQAALHLVPDYPRARLQLFNVRYRQRRFDEAIDLGLGLLEESELPGGRFPLRLARAYSGADRTQEGIRTLQRRTEAGRHELGGGLAVLWLAAGDTTAAERVARQTLRHDPLDEIAMDVIFDVTRRSNRLDQLQPLLEAALRENPRAVAQLNYLSFVRENAGDVAGAEELLLQALDNHPDHASSLANLGRIYIQSGRNAEAVPLLRRAVEAGPANLTVRMNLGLALEGAGDLDEAIAQYERLVAETRPDTALYNTLAEAYARRGDTALSARWFRRSLEIDGDQPRVRRRLTELEARLD